MKMTCEVIRDLMPLYHDGVCSDRSKSLVEEHLKECEACRKEMDIMDAELTPPHISPEREKSFRAVATAWKKTKKKAFAKGLAVTVAVLFTAAVVFCLMFSFKVMEGMSMAGHIDDGDICLVSRFAYTASTPVRGDVVFVKAEIDGQTFGDIVRVVALPGDELRIENGILYINSEVSSAYEGETVLPFDIDEPVTLGMNEYFVMGDNQAHSVDSRSATYGLLSDSQIKGKVLYIFSPITNPFADEAAALKVNE